MKGPGDVPFLVKVCGVTSAAEGQVAVEAGANAIGFNFYSRSPRYVTLRQAGDMARQVEGAYWRVGVFVSPRYEDLLAASEETGIEVAQVHGALPERWPDGLRRWRAMAPAQQPPAGEPEAEAYLLDTPSTQFGGTGRSFDWQQAANFRGRAILAGGLDGSNVEEAIRIAQPWGVDACSRLESAPGRKDANKVRQFVSAARRAAREMASPEITR